MISIKRVFLFFIFVTYAIGSFAQQSGYKCYPTNWWVGMKWNKVQVMIHGDGIGNANGYTINYPGIKIEKINRVENKNYVFIDLVISSLAKPGIAKIKVDKKINSFLINFEL